MPLTPILVPRFAVLCGALAFAGPAVATTSSDRVTAQPVSATGYVGSSSCKSCHESQFAAWSSSTHARAMRATSSPTEASPSKATFGKGSAGIAEFGSKSGVNSVSVQESGKQTKLELPYLLGTRPMEQYLAATGKGRVQALPVAFDVDKKEWFDIFAGEERLSGEFGHWTGRGMNANSQCIECHSTGFQKGYDSAGDAYHSSWAEMGVGCESCHGPGATHAKDPKAPYGPFGKSARIAEFRPAPTSVTSSPVNSNPDSVSPAAVPPPAASVMLETCATCHSVRRTIADGFVPGARFLDHYEPSILDEDLYWPDGSVRSESYEWGSFVQSRMYAAGVNCLACHDVHSGGLRAEGNGLCLSCHESTFESHAHTAHAEGTAASQCVSCHMPESVFMARDKRRDHSLAVPDPLLARESGLPSACESCHADRGREVLATDAERLWPRLKVERFAKRRSIAKAFAEARVGNAESTDRILECLSGSLCDTVILRASAARLTVRLPLTERVVGPLLEALKDPDPLVRSAAAFALSDVDPREPALRQSLSTAAVDASRAVRVNAAWALRTAETDQLPEEQARSLDKAFDEWRAATMTLSEAPESWHTLGVFESMRKDAGAAETAYRKAISIEPRATPTYHNLAMLLAATGRIDDSRKEFEALLAIDDSSAAAWYALGVIHGEQKNWKEAARALARCLKLDPGYPDALTDLANAYLEAGVPNVARAVLSGALEHPPLRREALLGLVTVALRAGTPEEAAGAARALVSEDPSAANDPEIARLLAPAAAQ